MFVVERVICLFVDKVDLFVDWWSVLICLFVESVYLFARWERGGSSTVAVIKINFTITHDVTSLSPMLHTISPTIHHYHQCNTQDILQVLQTFHKCYARARNVANITHSSHSSGLRNRFAEKSKMRNASRSRSTPSACPS